MIVISGGIFFLKLKYPSLIGTCGATGNLKEAEKHSISYF